MRNRVKSATPAMRRFIEDKAEEVKLPSEPERTQTTGAVAVQPDGSNASDTLAPPVAEAPEVEQVDDDSWLEGLTPYDEVQVQQIVEPMPARQPDPPAQQQVQPDMGTEEQQRRLAELYAGLEHIETEVATELHDKVIEPELQKVRAELEELKQYRQQEQQARRDAILMDVNTKIIEKYPKAQKILRSKEFMDYVNANNNPYATDTEFNNLQKAYYAGDANYVLSKLDGFVASRGKPKPPVGVEPQQGGGRSGVTDAVGRKKPMSDEEYRTKRLAIQSAPRGTYPPNALKDLAEEYLNSRG